MVFVVEEFWSTFQDILLSAFVTIWELRSLWLECTLKSRHLFLQPYQEALTWRPRILPLPSETLKHLALWILPCIPLRLWRCHSGAQVASCIPGGVSQVRRSSSDKGPSCSRRGLFFHPSSSDGWLQPLVLLSWHSTLELSLIRSIIYPLRLWLQVALASGIFTASSIKTGLCTKPQWKLTTSLFLGDVVHMLSLHCSACSGLFWICLFLNGFNCLRFACSFLLNAWHSMSSVFPLSDELQQSPWSNLCHRSTTSWVPLLRRAACSLALSPAHSANSFLFFCSLNNGVQASGQILSGLVVFWIFVGLPFTHLCPSRSLVRRIWNLAVAVHSSARVTPFASNHESLIVCSETCFFFRLSLSHHVDVFQWDRECFIIWVVKLQTTFFMMSMNKFSTHRPRIFCCASLVVAFFDFHVIFRFEVSLCWQWRSWTIRKAKGSVSTRKFLRLLIHANLHSLPSSSLLTNLLPHVEHRPGRFLSALSFQTDVLLTCLSR